jgi:TolA-binding protein
MLAASSISVGQTTQPASDREARLAARSAAKANESAAELFRTADTTYLVGDLARAGELYRQILTLAPNSVFTVRVTARLGDCAYEAKNFDQAVAQYRRATLASVGVADPEEQLAGVRADYMMGQSYLAAKQYTQAFGAFRRFIDRHGTDPLVNKAYQSIGDAHMALEQHQQALDAYRMVGTVFDAKLPTHKRISPGQRLYLRVNDADVNIADTPRSVWAKVTTTSGDQETVELKPLGLRSPVFIATVPTELGKTIKSGTLADVFPPTKDEQLRGLLQQAEKSKAKANESAGELAALQRQGAGADPAGFERKRTSLSGEVDFENKTAADMQKQAYAAVDQAYQAIENVLNQWSPDQNLAAVKKKAASPTTAPTTAPALQANVDDAMAAALARPLGGDEEELTAPDAARRGLTQADIDKLRLDVAATPTDVASFDKRLTGLTIWHRSLIRQFQRLELRGGDTITVDYFDEVGQNGPNQRDKATRKDTIVVAADGRIAMLTPDGEQEIAEAVLGGQVRLQVADADHDKTDKPDTLTAVLCAVEPATVKQEVLPSTTQPSDGRATPGLIAAAPTTQPVLQVPLVIDGAPNIKVTLTETGDHTGVFEATVSLSDKELDAQGQKLPLDARKHLRLSYQDATAIRFADNHVHATAVDCVEDKGGTVAAVKYRLTPLDLQARLSRAVASGEIGKIYLELGLESRGKAYLANAQADCTEVSRLAGKSALGEDALYHSWRIYFYAGLLDESVAAANRLIQAYPLSEYCDDAMLAIGQVSLEQGKKANEEAIAAGRTASLNRDLQRAVNQLDALVKKYPNSPSAPEALFLIGQAKISAGQTGLDAFEQLAKQFPDSGFAAKGLIQAADYYVSIADYRRAQEYFGRVLIDYPDSPQRGDVLLKRGICQYKLGQNAEALQTLYQIAEDHSGGDLAAQAKRYIGQINQSRGEKQ